MSQTLIAWFEDVDQGGAAADIAAVQDDSVFTAGDIIRVPRELAHLLGAAYTSAATTFTAAQVQSPSLRTLANFDINPVSLAATFAGEPEHVWIGENPLALTPFESLTFNTDTDHAAPIEIYGLVWLGDGPQRPVNGEIFTVRATAAAALVDGVWVNSNLTFTQDLPSGSYDVVGLRVVSTNGIAARLVFPGFQWRPGVIVVNAESDIGLTHMRGGRAGLYGNFDSNVPPTIDILGVTDSAQVVFLDLIKVG